MIVKKKDIDRVMNILSSFGNEGYITTISENRVSAKSHIVKYISERLSKDYRPLAEYTDKDGTKYFIEKIGSLLYLTRSIDGHERKVVLQNDDLALIKDINKISKKEIKNLVQKVAIEELRFPL